MSAGLLERATASWLRLELHLADAREAQWQPGRTPTPREDTSERSKGMVSDPTPSITADPRRQKLRAAVLEAEAVRATFRAALATAEEALSEALAPR